MTAPIQVDTLIIARWVIPVIPQRTLLENQAIALKDGKIAAIISAAEAADYQANETVQLNEQHVVMPGLINTHGHAAMALMRGMADDYPLHTWLNEHIWPAESQWVSEEFVHDGSQLAIAEMLRSGTTCFSDMYFFPETTAKVAIEAGIRTQLSFPVFSFPSAWGNGPEDYIHKGLQLHDDFKHSDLVNIVFGPHAPYTVDDATLSKISTYAFELDCQIQIHLHETAQEIDDALRDTGKRPIARLNDLGILSPRTQCVHMTTINDDDIDLIKATGSHIVHCPQSNLKLASGFTPVAQLMSEDINVCLGTDGAASNNSLNMFAEMRTAGLLAKAVANDAAAVSDWQALEMATINGAKAMGLEHTIGSLETGKTADLVAVDLSELEQQPVYEPISQLVYTDCGHKVSDSWIAGRRVLQNRQLTTLDATAIKDRCNHWRNRIRS